MNNFSDARMLKVVRAIMAIQSTLYIHQVRSIFQIMFPNVSVEHLDESVRKVRTEKRMGVPPVCVMFYER